MATSTTPEPSPAEMLKSFNPERHGGESTSFPPVGLEVGAPSNCSVTELKGMFGKSGKAVSIEDMNQAIARQNLPSGAAETLLRLHEIHHMAADIFATEEGASAWLRTPHPLLENERPLDAAKTSAGAQAVKNLLMSTTYGGAA